MAAIELQQSIKFASEELFGKSREEKLEWSRQKRERGNDLYKERKYSQALDMYITSLAGLDFGSGEEQKVEATTTIQIPVLCNMAACFLAMKDWVKVEAITSQAISLDSMCFKALSRRSMARIHLGKLALAAQDVETASQCEGVEDKETQVDKLRKMLLNAEKLKTENERRQRETARRMFANVNSGSLYEDKGEIKVNGPIGSVLGSIGNGVMQTIAKFVLWVASYCTKTVKKKE